MKAILPLLIGLLLGANSPVAFAKDEPTVKSTKFDNPLEDVFYFDDSDILLAHDPEEGVVYRSDNAGETWKKVAGEGQEGHSWGVLPHPYDNQRAYIIGDGKEHWMTKDQGKSWKKFNLGSNAPTFGDSLAFHGRDPKKVIWNGENCSGFLSCSEVALYTEDDFETTKSMGDDMRRCYWAASTPMFAAEIAKEVDNRVFCIKKGVRSSWQKDNKMVVSDDYFKKQEVEPALEQGRAVSGVTSMAAVKKYLVAAAKSEGTDEMALYVTDDSSMWHRAEFGRHRVNEEAYTILESTNYSMQVDVMISRPTNPMGYLFTSNSNGTYFTKNVEYTNRSPRGRVDFEKVANIQGIVLVNTVVNHEEVDKTIGADKKIISQISFDDGRTFEPITADKEDLHLHSVTDARQVGRIFSSPAPGIVMGVGNTGKYLKSYTDGDLFVSDNAGLTWRKALDGAHLYEIGNNGAILVAVDDTETTDKVQYSLDHGKTWKKVELEDKISAKVLTTVSDSTTVKFLLAGFSGSGDKAKWMVYKLDFDGLHERKCKDKDVEKWPARVDEKGEPTCVMGHKQFYRRRKADADCFIDADFKDPEPEFEKCVCTDADFECDFNFVRSSDGKDCVATADLTAPADKCKNPEDKYLGSSGFRLIPGNECIRKGGVDKDKEVERPCSESSKKPATGEIGVEKTNFKAKSFSQWMYLERADKARGNDETIIMSTDEGEIYLSRDHGKEWNPILKGKQIVEIVPSPYYSDAVYFLTDDTTVYYTHDRGETFRSFEVPEQRADDELQPLKFHPDYKDWMLWSGVVGKDGHTNVFLSKDRGDDWSTLARYTRKCEFIHRGDRDKMIYCTQHEDENLSKHVQLVSSENFFDTHEVKFPNILDFTTMAEFIIVAQKMDNDQDLKVDASVDGQTFAAAQFPKNFVVKHQQAYTVLDSSTHAVFLHVTVNSERNYEYGSIIKSNSNGTSYVMTLDAVNRDVKGYVDFEKMQGIEGVAMVNIVANLEEVNRGKEKKLKSKITHNDGAEWALVPAPQKDANGKAYACVGSKSNVAEDKCSLHLHSYTERRDKSATFSSPSAVGMMLAVGNVGEFLGSKSGDETDTFITRDAGINWKAIKKGAHLWEYGDQGSVIIVVPNGKATRSLSYTLNEGEEFIDFEFTDVDMEIYAVTTLPSDNSLQFLLWGLEVGKGSKGGIFTVNIDFSQLKQRSRLCKLDEAHPTQDDYDLWSPKHPLQDGNCLFGHVAEYHRKKLGADCYNGKQLDHLHDFAQNCTCTRQDFECDYNFELGADGTCALVSGLSAPDPVQICKQDPDKEEYWLPTGYRKIPLSTCQGGRELDKIKSEPCPGHEGDYAKKHGIRGFALFLAIVLPLACAGGVGYWVWTQYLQRGFGSFGQIRLGESLGSGSSSRGESPFITIPVAIIAGVVAVTKALPLLASSMFRSAKGYMPLRSGASGPYRSRDAFASRRNDYAGAAYIEDDELLGGDEEDADADEV